MVNNNTNPDTMRKRINNLESANYAEEIEVLNADIENIFENTAPEYDKAQSYNEGDFVISEGVLYKAKQTTTGNFDTTKWESTTIVENLGGGGGGLKSKTYTGTGTTETEIAIGEIPNYIIGLTSVGTYGETYIMFPFKYGLTNVPTAKFPANESNIEFKTNTIRYSEDQKTMKIWRGGETGEYLFNNEGTKYTLYYM